MKGINEIKETEKIRDKKDKKNKIKKKLLASVRNIILPIGVCVIFLKVGVSQEATTIYASSDVGYSNLISGITATDVKGAVFQHSTGYTEINSIIGNNTLTTTSQTLKGGINEVNDKFGNFHLFIDSTNVVFHAAETTWTATYDCYFHALGVNNTTTHYFKINNINVALQDYTNGIYITSASGFLKTGDTVTTNFRYVVYGLK